jgi:diacylglycerol kinase (ATP)
MSTDPRNRGGGATTQTRGWRRVVNATRYSLAGLRYAWGHESAFRQELILALLMAPAALWLGATAVERALLIGCLFLVLIVEVLNSSIEAVVDRVGAERHPLSGLAKDLGSAAVFLSLGNVITIWGLVLWTRLPELISQLQLSQLQ